MQQIMIWDRNHKQ